eukprot:s481_g15.t1
MARQRLVSGVVLGLVGATCIMSLGTLFVGPRQTGSNPKVIRYNVGTHPSQIFPGGAATATAPPPTPMGSPMNNGASSKPRMPPIPMPFGDVSVDMTMMRFSHFVPRLYNFCRGLGMTKGRIMPSIGFCADENQGFPIITITKHFGAYPFTHGYIGGIMALDRHGPHSHHGDDFVIIHAPHVGYDPDSEKYGIYRRRQMADPHHSMSTCCGKVAGTLAPYVDAYEKALGRISVREAKDGVVLLNIGNSLLNEEEDDLGIALNFDRLLEPAALENPLLLQSTSVVYIASKEFTDLYRSIKTQPSNAAPGGQGSQARRESFVSIDDLQNYVTMTKPLTVPVTTWLPISPLAAAARLVSIRSRGPSCACLSVKAKSAVPTARIASGMAAASRWRHPRSHRGA